MGKVVIVTDSTATLPPELAKQYGITVLPQILIWGKETLYDGVDIQPDQFYERLSKANVMPSSSQVSPGTFENTFRDLLAQGYDVLAPVLSSKLSGTISSAVQAHANLGELASRVEVIDTFAVATPVAFALLQAARVAEQGGSLAECKSAVEHTLAHAGILIVVDTLEFLHRGGRIGGAQRLLGTALNLKPILEVTGGRIEPFERVRTRSKAQSRMMDTVAERVGDKPVRIGIVHANNRADAESLLKQATERMNVIESMITPVSPVLGTHVGPGTVGVGYAIEK
jgi:DegV family protein with EDD domain